MARGMAREPATITSFLDCDSVHNVILGKESRWQFGGSAIDAGTGNDHRGRSAAAADSELVECGLRTNHGGPLGT